MAQATLDIGHAARTPRPSACPGLFRIVGAHDGGICRIKLPLGHLTAAQARAIAAAAARFGNGMIEITNRANLQIRGVPADGETSLIDMLLAAGLGPTQPETDDIRNVMVSPTAGIDPQQRLDALPLARGLLAHIERDADCRSLSPKFSFLVDGGEGVAVIARPHDLWLASTGDGDMALGFAGSPPLRIDDATPFITVPADRAIDAVAAAIRLFLEAATGNSAIVRFRDLFFRMTRERFLDRLSQELGTRERREPEIATWRRKPFHSDCIGVRDQRQEGMSCIGAAPPLARLTPAMLKRIAKLADGGGDGTIRLTPWHSAIVPSVPRTNAADVLGALGSIGFVTAPRDPLASMVACSGSAGCHAGLSDTKSDALALAAALGETMGTIHVSGCAKGCASATVDDMTLIAVKPGSYDVFVKDEGAGRLAHCLARGLGISEIGVRLKGRLT